MPQKHVAVIRFQYTSAKQKKKHTTNYGALKNEPKSDTPIKYFLKTFARKTYKFRMTE